jgi:two-component system response regulator NreC
LTDREQEVLRFVAEGATNDEIAGALVISPSTVARHRENIMQKLELHSRSELVRYAIRKGIIKP